MYSNVWSSIIFGAFFGFLLLSPLVGKIIQKKDKEKSKIEEIKFENQEDNKIG